MNNILLINNSSSKINSEIVPKIIDFANITITKLLPKKELKGPDIADYDYIIVHTSDVNFEDVVGLAGQLRKLNFFNYIFLTEKLDQHQSETLIDYSPIFHLDINSLCVENIYNLASVLSNEFFVVKDQSVSSDLSKEINSIITEYITYIKLFKKHSLIKSHSTEKSLYLQKKHLKKVSQKIIPIKRLSERELELFFYILEGKTSKKISDEMHIQQSTLATHKARMFKKLGINSVAELVKLAYKYKLIS